MEIDIKTAPGVPMETNSDDGASLKVAAAEARRPEAPKAAAVPSGLPQSREELETLISTIHQTVNNSVLPRLHKCLTAKVQCARTKDLARPENPSMVI